MRRQSFFVPVLLCLAFCLQWTEIYAVQNAPLQKIGYNYVAELVVDSADSYPLVVSMFVITSMGRSY